MKKNTMKKCSLFVVFLLMLVMGSLFFVFRSNFERGWNSGKSMGMVYEGRNIIVEHIEQPDESLKQYCFIEKGVRPIKSSLLFDSVRQFFFSVAYISGEYIASQHMQKQFIEENCDEVKFLYITNGLLDSIKKLIVKNKIRQAIPLSYTDNVLGITFEQPFLLQESEKVSVGIDYLCRSFDIEEVQYGNRHGQTASLCIYKKDDDFDDAPVVKEYNSKKDVQWSILRYKKDSIYDELFIARTNAHNQYYYIKTSPFIWSLIKDSIDILEPSVLQNTLFSEEVDRGSFRFLDSFYAKDARRVYYISDDIYPVDTKGRYFSVLKDGYATDGEKYFKDGHPINLEDIPEDVSGLYNLDLWTLTQGDALDSCSSPSFSGDVTLEGWIELAYFYVSKELLFRVSDDSLKKLPLDLKEYPYVRISPSLAEKYKDSSQEKPFIIRARSFSYYCEGTPWID